MVVGGRPNLVYSPLSFVLGPSCPDLGPDLDLTWDLDLSLTIEYAYESRLEVVWIFPVCCCNTD